MLAFLDNICIGAGRVEHHRSDLEAAGLGDGYSGFAFPIQAPSDADAKRVVVKLDGSDAWIARSDARIVGAKGADAQLLSPRRYQERLKSYKWMLSRGWLSQSDYDYFKTFVQFGVYERTLVGTAGAEEGFSAEVASARTGELLSLLSQSKSDLVTLTPRSPEEFATTLTAFRGEDRHRAIGIWCKSRATLNVAEGSHRQTQEGRGGEHQAFVGVALEADRVIIIDPRCLATLDPFTPGDIQLFCTPTRPD